MRRDRSIEGTTDTLGTRHRSRGDLLPLTPACDRWVDVILTKGRVDQRMEVDRYLRVARLLRPPPFPLDLLVKTPTEIIQAFEKEDPCIREITTQGRVCMSDVRRRATTVIRRLRRS